MSTNRSILPVIPVPGLPPSSLGAYLAALGLLKVLSRRWPDARAAWRDGVLHIVGGPPDRDALADALMSVADQASWTPYARGWADAQKASTKAKSGAKLAQWQATTDEEALELFAAHAAPASRVFFNPLLGSGGNAGRRAFADGWTRAKHLVAGKADVREPTERRGHLLDLLSGSPIRWANDDAPLFPGTKKPKKGSLNAGSWFSETVISPWAMVLACEGLAFFAGGASRRLGARARSIGAFPFVVAGAAPETAGEAGRDDGEVWAPLWARPMTAPEVAALFARGRAEIGGRGAVTPAAFAAAIMRRGVDAGISEFRRFALGKTTSANTFEPRYLGAAPVPTGAADAKSEAYERVLGLIEKLPPDKKVGQRWRFVGLRGPIESALVSAASAHDDPEAAAALLDATAASLDRVDVNQSHRKQSVAWRPLPLAWLPALFGGDAPDVEARLALSLACAFSADYPFALYRFGVEWRDRNRDGRPRKNSVYVHSKTPPARWVWRTGSLTRSLGAVLQRRLLGWENEHERAASPAFARVTARLSDIEAWLDGNVDEALLGRWLSRLALFDWSFDRTDIRAHLALDNKWNPSTPVGPALALYGLLSPLFDLGPVRQGGQRDGRDLLPPETGARTPGAARRMVALIRGGDVERAIDVARSRYAIANAPLMRTEAPCAVENPERLLAALMFPVSSSSRAALVRRWLRPKRQSDEVTHV